MQENSVVNSPDINNRTLQLPDECGLSPPKKLEKIYENALCIELKRVGLRFEKQKNIPVNYKGEKIGEHRLDLLVEDSIVVEIKSAEHDNPVFQAQLLSYMKLGNYKLGLLINFNKKLVKNGIKRMIL